MEIDGGGPTLLFCHTLVVRVRSRGQQIVSTVNGVTTAVVRSVFGHCGVVTAGENVVVPRVVGRLDGAVAVVFGVTDSRRRRRTAIALHPRRMWVDDDPRRFLVAFLLLHTPVLEPYLYLPLGQAQLGRHLLSLVPHYVPGSLEYRLQHGRLVFGVRLPGPFAGTWKSAAQTPRYKNRR